MIKITNTSDSALIQIFGDIGDSFWGDGWTLEKFAAQLKGLDVPNLTIELKSNGGDLFEAFAIYDSIRNLPARVTVDIVGASASAATIIASGADKIRISENSNYLVHNARTFVEGNKEEMKEVFDQLSKFDNQILDIYVKRTGKTKDVLSELMKQEKWITAQEALNYGFVDEIIKQKIENKMEQKNLFTNAEQDALQAENEQLKAKVAELEAKLAEMESAQTAAIEEDVTAKVENAIKEGKLKADQKEAWINLGKLDNISMTAALNAIYVPKLKDVANTAAGSGKLTEKEFLNNWRANKYAKDKEAYAKDYKEVYGKEAKI